MAISKPSAVEHITPSRSELHPFHKIHCQEDECSAIFTNAGNYELHLLRHHKIKPLRDGKKEPATRLYYCPDTECVYHYRRGNAGRHFNHMKNLRQHFQKVHIKNNICERCGRAFPTPGQFKAHLETACGKQFRCETCNWIFETKEALSLHSKRKGHIQAENEPKINVAVLPTKRKLSKTASHQEDSHTKQSKRVLHNSYSQQDSELSSTQHKDTQTNIFSHRADSFTNTNNSCELQTQFQDIQTQTEQLLAACLMPTTSVLENINTLCHDTETQTEATALTAMNCVDSNNVLDEIQALHHHDIETQTEPTSKQRHTSPMHNSNTDVGFLDQMLAQTPLTHMHTQTCDDYLLSELGLTDIQTQTNWTSFSVGSSASEQSKDMYTTTSTSTSTTGFAHDELLVSTETQTSFTQCLLDSTAGSNAITTGNATTCSTGCGTSEDSNGSNYVHLYNTQQTQTCDLLLGLFGGQESDFIAEFQSTYTQT